ncbi:MAG: hypothetical protein QF755_03835 [Candidatus Peribacteraceae bacterium]|jgi:starch synthase|nr:hypothetical protein [Candidatus Peribacteraceae bacterium]HCI04019.1 hypothetical protein [Candidatus Peribacteria bacterium]|tara:strand:+ start:4237 stop:4845 length:609 start_codon:yes stop_codon:yes gene_type:complete
MSNLSPSTDQSIAQKYSAETLEKKIKNKTALQKELGWPAESKRMMLCLPVGMTKALGGELLEELIQGLETLPIELLIRGKGTKEYGELFTKLAQDKNHRFAIVPDKEDAVNAMFAAADASLFLSDPSDLPELELSLKYGAIPIAPECEKLEAYDPIQESGVAFTYENPDVWSVFAAIVRALETHRFPFDWRTVQRYCMESVK